MEPLKRYQDIDLAPFQSDAPPRESRYGLPLEVKYCTKCYMSNQRPNTVRESDHRSDSLKTTINFDENGVCDACHVAESKRHYDWDDRERQLIELCDRYRRDDGRYDCIIPGSGGKDSFYTAHVLIDISQVIFKSERIVDQPRHGWKEYCLFGHTTASI